MTSEELAATQRRWEQVLRAGEELVGIADEIDFSETNREGHCGLAGRPEQ